LPIKIPWPGQAAALIVPDQLVATGAFESAHIPICAHFPNFLKKPKRAFAVRAFRNLERSRSSHRGTSLSLEHCLAPSCEDSPEAAPIYQLRTVPTNTQFIDGGSETKRGCAIHHWPSAVLVAPLGATLQALRGGLGPHRMDGSDSAKSFFANLMTSRVRASCSRSWSRRRKI